MARSLTGIVASDKPDKSIVVSVQTTKTHPIYRKRYVVHTKFMAHDEKNEAKHGDRVVIVETRPLSARKRYVLESIAEKATVQHVEPEVKAATKVKKTDAPAQTTQKAIEEVKEDAKATPKKVAAKKKPSKTKDKV